MKKFLKNNWVYLIGVFFVFVIYLVRFYHLTILPIFADEAIYIRWAQVMKAEETLRFLPLSDGKEPLFMWVMIPFFKIINDPLFAGRIVSVLSGLGTLLGVSFLSYLLFKSKKAVLAAAFIYAVSPFTFFFDRMALVDSMLSMFGIWTFIFAYLAFTLERMDFAMIAGFALGGAWLTKSPALFFALMLPTLWFFAAWKRGSKNILKTLAKLIGLTMPILIIGYGLYNILRLGPNFSMIAKRNLDYVWPISHILTSPFDPLKPWLLQSWQWIVMMGPWSILILAIASIILGYKKFWRELLVVFVWFLGPIVIQSEFAKVLTSRYIFFSIPFLIILAASSFETINKTWLKFLALVLAFFVAQSIIFDYHLIFDPEKANLPRSERSGYLEEWTAGQGIKESADYFKSMSSTLEPGQHILAGTEGYFGTLPDGLEIYLNNISNIIVVGVGLDFTKLPQPLADSYKSGSPTYLVVNDERFHGDAEQEGLKLIASYPKAERPNGTHQSLLLYQVTQLPKQK